MFGERLAEIRKDHGHKQADLAQRLNVSLATVRSWEQGKSSPGYETLTEICRMYHITSDYLLGLSDVYPLYQTEETQTLFDETELQALKEYKAFLLWKRKKK